MSKAHDWKRGDWFRVSADINTEYYHVRCATEGTIEADALPHKKNVLATLDEIDGDLNACLFIPIRYLIRID